LYHAAAVLAGPLTSALASLAAELWSALGQDREAGRRALAPLFLQTARHFAAHPIPESMTGPFTRGDLEPARAHLEALRRTRPELLRAYASLALAQLPLAAEHGKIAEERMDELRTLLTDAATDEAG